MKTPFFSVSFLDKCKQRQNLRQITPLIKKTKQDEMATEQESLSASPKLNITTSHHIFLVSLYLPHLPHMSDNIKSLCSSKVSSIKNTRGSAHKTANVKMAKKSNFFSEHTPLSSTWGGEPASWWAQGFIGVRVRMFCGTRSPLQLWHTDWELAQTWAQTFTANAKVKLTYFKQIMWCI